MATAKSTERIAARVERVADEIDELRDRDLSPDSEVAARMVRWARRLRNAASDLPDDDDAGDGDGEEAGAAAGGEGES